MDKLKQLETLAKKISVCEKCDLHKTRTNAVPGRGHYDPKIFFIGEFPGCFVEDVEVLTDQRGWQHISKLTYHDLVAQYTDGIIDFVTPKNIIISSYNGVIEKYEGRLNFSVTPNHKFKIFNTYHNKFFTRISNNISMNYAEEKIPISGVYDTDHKILPKWLIRLIVAIQADGSYESTGIRFDITKPRKIDRLKSILKQGNVTHREGGKNKKGSFRVTIPKNSEVYALSKIMLDDKKFSYDLIHLHLTNRIQLIEETKYWDGSLDSRKQHRIAWDYCSCIPQNIEVLQAICHMSNYKAFSQKDSRILGIVDRNLFGVKALNKSLIDYEGLVYCITVDSGFFLVRVNKQVFITGNSEEDEEALPFIGQSGEMIDEWVDYVDVLDSEYAISNVGKCHPPNNRDPKLEEILACRDWLEQEIKILEPEIFVCVGRYATAWFLGKEYMTGITKYGGKFINDVYYPIPHPSYFLRNGARNKPEIWQPYLEELKLYVEENFD